MIIWLSIPGFLLMLLLVVVSIVYSDYKRAQKKQIPSLSVSYNSLDEVKIFRPHLASLAPMTGGLILVVVIAVTILNNSKFDEISKWDLAGMFGFFVLLFLYYIIKTLKGHLKIDKQEIVYQGVFFKRAVDVKTIEAVHEGNAAFYIKQKSKRWPLIIDKMFCSDKAILNALQSLMHGNTGNSSKGN